MYVDPSGHVTTSAADKAPDLTPDQQAVRDIVDEVNRNGGPTPSDENIIRDWAREYGLDPNSLNFEYPTYKMDANGRWHRENGQFASNAEVDAYRVRQMANVPIPDGVTYEGPLYRNVGTIPNGTELGLPINPLTTSAYTRDTNYRYTQSGVNGLYFASSQHVMEGEMAAYKSDLYAANRSTYYYSNVSLDNMLDLTNPSTRNSLNLSIYDLTRSDYKGYKGTEPSRAATHVAGNFAYEHGYRGLIVPSARADGGVNIVIFDPSTVNFRNYTTITAPAISR